MQKMLQLTHLSIAFCKYHSSLPSSHFSLLPYGNYTHTEEEILKVTTLQESTAHTKNKFLSDCIQLQS